MFVFASSRHQCILYFLYLHHSQLHCSLTYTHTHTNILTTLVKYKMRSHMHRKHSHCTSHVARQVVFYEIRCREEDEKKNQCDKIDTRECNESNETHVRIAHIGAGIAKKQQRAIDISDSYSDSDNSKSYKISFAIQSHVALVFLFFFCVFAFFIINLLCAFFFCFLIVLCVCVCFLLRFFNYFITGGVVAAVVIIIRILWFLFAAYVCYNLLHFYNLSAFE